VNNLAPFSYFSAVGHDPPTVCIGICKNRDGKNKDTLQNIIETGEFVVNMISDWMVESANHCSGMFPSEIDELKLVGLTPIASELVKPHRVAESAFQMECKVTSIQEIFNDEGVCTTSAVIGRVHRFHCLENLLEEGPRGLPQVNYEAYRALGRAGGDKWIKMGDYFEIERPSGR
jgi:flavin reductase (DIM6/NTAB) family NADH-FMN oxidoreductase RutF